MRRGTANYGIHDRAEVAAIVEQIIREVGRGNEADAAKAIGMSQPTINRLRHSALDRITHPTAVALEHGAKAVGDKELVPRLAQAIVSPDAMRRYHTDYKAWCVERLSRFEERTLGMSGEQAREGVRELWRITHAEFPEQFKRFAEAMATLRVDATREQVAVVRIIEPLLEAPASGGIERRWTELTQRERQDFIEAGIRRELIMLNREPALVRAKQADGNRRVAPSQGPQRRPRRR